MLLTRISSYVLVACTGVLACQANAQNVVDAVTNGNFSQGNSGFVSQYTYTAAAAGLDNQAGEGRFGISDPGASPPITPNYLHKAFLTSLGSIPEGGRAMIVNGYSTRSVPAVPNSVVWSQPVQLIAGVTYTLQASATSVISSNTSSVNQALPTLEFQLTDAPVTPDAQTGCMAQEGTLVGTLKPNPLTPAAPGLVTVNIDASADWKTFTQTVSRPQSGTYCLRIYNETQLPIGNDFALAGISLRGSVATPVAVDDTFNTDVNTPITNATVVTNDPTAPADAQYVLQTPLPQGQGTLTFNDDGTFSYSPDGYVGQTTFTYVVCTGFDPNKICSEPATVTITVRDTVVTPPSTPASVPTLGLWSLMGLSALLGFLGMARRRG